MAGTPKTLTEAVQAALIEELADIRKRGGLRGWMRRHKGEAHWKKIWESKNPKRVRGVANVGG